MHGYEPSVGKAFQITEVLRASMKGGILHL